jgi:thiamine pyrophosphokinase
MKSHQQHVKYQKKFRGARIAGLRGGRPVLDPYDLIRVMPAEGKFRKHAPEPSPAEGFFMPQRTAWIFVNGELGFPILLSDMIHTDDWLIAADGGYHLVKALKLAPSLVIGDLDSLKEQDLEEIKQSKIPLQRFPQEKDETDLELAINAAVARGSRSIRIVGASGGRQDQELGILFQLLRPDLAAVDARLEDGRTEAWLLRTEGVIQGEVGDTVSLLPMGSAVHGIITEGLRYPLRAETLWPYKTRGISNVMESKEARIVIREGTLICVHIRKQPS